MFYYYLENSFIIDLLNISDINCILHVTFKSFAEFITRKENLQFRELIWLLSFKCISFEQTYFDN
jgi:hypothetical protein